VANPRREPLTCTSRTSDGVISSNSARLTAAGLPPSARTWQCAASRVRSAASGRRRVDPTAIVPAGLV
jgi:hypothetical protein